MPRLLIIAAFLALASPLRAGVYNLAHKHPYLSLDDTRGYYLRARSAAIPSKGEPAPESYKALLLRQVAALESLKADGNFSTLDRVNLAGAYLQLGGDRLAAARQLLIAGDPEHFLIQSNLAAAYFLSGEFAMAIRHQERALDLWPVVFAGWSDQLQRSYREAERYLLLLYRQRAAEADPRGGADRHEKDVDALFPRVRFVGASGEYEAGALAAAMRDQLPYNAFDIVYQLNLWFPTDMRLYWLLGELYNVAGSIDQAHDVFVELVEAGMARSFKDLAKHRRALKEAKPAYVQFRDAKARGVLLSQLLMVGRPAMTPPVVGDVAYLSGCSATALFTPQAGQDPMFPTFPTNNPDAAAVEKRETFTFIHVAIGFGFGFVVAMLLSLQWQEWRRRRSQAAPSEEREPVPLSPPGRSAT